MKSFFSSRISKLGGLITFCTLSVTTFSPSAMADPISDLQNEVAKRGKSPEDVNQAMRAKFPDSAFPYYGSVNGCSTPWYVFPLTNSANKWFKGACDNHDVCYMTPSKSRFTCDVLFREELFRVCEVTSNLECRFTAEEYYVKVRENGQEFYDAAQSEQSEYIKSVDDWLNSSNATVFQTNSYISTEISVNPGDRIKIKASGRVGFGLFAGSGGPNGIIIDPTYNYFVNVPHGRLMARFYQPGMGALEGWSPIGVGWDEVREVKLPVPGVLEFLVNDNEPGNNSGEFRIEVTIHPAKE